ncbi:aldehyde dehydrogenase [Microbacterium sp. A93]|uniref:aldehyde dehydrogenase n=1 Tax=Microbacterium sp. A93 TaxID=3450716 RepID=UPI003F4233C6
MTTTSSPADTTTDATVPSYHQLFIGGRWVEPSSDARIEVVSPITGQVIASVPEAMNADMDAAVAAARKAFDEGPWPRMSPAERAEILGRVGQEVKNRVEAMAASFTAEIGAPAASADAFHANAVKVWDDVTSLHERFSFEEDRTWDGGTGTIVREPVGVVATILPWNGPVATASLKFGPALAAGCTVVVKPAPEGPVSMMMLAEAIEAAGLPEGVVSMLPAGREAGEHLVRHRDVDMITFTGSTAAGRKIMGIAAERIAPVTLELGGKSAAIITDDVDLDTVFPNLVFFGIGHSGQVCAALTRILVPRQRQDEVVERIKSVMESLKIGDPRESDTVLGPLAAERQRDRVESYIEIGKNEGARLVTGGGRPPGLDQGWFVEPTLFADVTPDMRIAQEEIFGPVLTVIPYDTIEDAIEIANGTDYGLSGAVFAKDNAAAEKIARRVKTGQIGINSWTMNVIQPFGGYKQSGLGREGGVEGMEEFLETKLIMNP